ncbi:MAG: helix-turn-helix domain-containing protein [Variovorax sp.]
MSVEKIIRTPGRPQSPATDRKFVVALARGLDILGAFENEGELGNLDIATRCRLPRATVTRLTYTLASMGYLRQMPNGKFAAGIGFLGLSASIQRNLGVQRVARPYMQALAIDLNCTVVMAMRDRMSMVFLEVARPVHTGLTVNTDAGSAVPIHSTAVGLAWLAAAPLLEREQVLAALQADRGGRNIRPSPDSRNQRRGETDTFDATEDWESVRRNIEQAHQALRKDGFVVRLRSWHRDVNAVAAALNFDAKQNVYSFFCGGPSQSLPRSVLLELHGPRLKAMVAKIRSRMQTERPLKLVKPAATRQPRAA